MIAAVIALALVTGCVAPVTSYERRTTDRTMSPPITDRTDAIVVRTVVSDATVVVTAAWPRTCHREVTDELVDTETRRNALVGTTDGDRWGYPLLVGMILAWPIGLGAAGYSLITYRAPATTVAHHHVAVGSFTRPCRPLPATEIVVHLKLPSGAVIDGITDDSGRFIYLMAASDAGSGVATAWIAIPSG